MFTDLIGKPFEYCAKGPEAYDCWGLVIECLNRFGADTSKYDSSPENREKTQEFARDLMNGKFVSTEKKPGVIVLMSVSEPHVGLVLGADKFIHCSERVGSVCIDRLSNYKNAIVGYYEKNI
jgi:cell wall-associated NlpC family hydrolase